MQADLAVHLDHPRGDLDKAQTQRVELGDGKAGTLWHCGAQVPHQLVGTGMQEQPELVGRRSGAGCAIGGARAGNEPAVDHASPPRTSRRGAAENHILTSRHQQDAIHLEGQDAA